MPAYQLADFSLGMLFPVKEHRFSMQLNVNNLFDVDARLLHGSLCPAEIWKLNLNIILLRNEKPDSYKPDRVSKTCQVLPQSECVRIYSWWR